MKLRIAVLTIILLAVVALGLFFYLFVMIPKEQSQSAVDEGYIRRFNPDGTETGQHPIPQSAPNENFAK